MKKLASLGVGVLLVCGYLACQAAPASARAPHHHRHNHHHKHRPSPPSITCGTGTVNINNVCVVTSTVGTTPNPGGSGVPGSGGVTVSPNTASLTPAVPAVAGQGRISSNFSVAGLPPITHFTVTASGPGCTLIATPAAVTSDVTGRTSFAIASTSATCTPGIYLITLTETAAPGTPFTVLVSVGLNGGGGGGGIF